MILFFHTLTWHAHQHSPEIKKYNKNNNNNSQARLTGSILKKIRAY